jgi:hypothetical protein
MGRERGDRLRVDAITTPPCRPEPLEAAALRWIMQRYEAIGQHCEFFEKEQMTAVGTRPSPVWPMSL